jgi:uncharacterized protein YndB with AHSA1/START domain/SAM-dependent methyltransferase
MTTPGELQLSGAFAGIPPTPPFDLTRQAKAFQPLGGVAFPVVQDRWERLVTMANIPASANRVWEALTDPHQVRNWLAVCHGKWATRDEESTLDFEDGEFFYCRTSRSSPPTAARPGILTYLWRWVGIGPATSVTWTVGPTPQGTTVTVVEEATNPPSDWRSWNGMGWPGILDQLAAYLRTGTNWRWPWRRMGPYLQIPLPIMPFQAWEALTSPGAIKFWMQRTAGSFDPDDELTLVMGDASGTVKMRVTKSIDSGQDFPSYLPYIEFELRRPAWTAALGGRMWIEPAGLEQSLLQIFHYDWERLDLPNPVTERKLLTNFWVNAAARVQLLFQPRGAPAGPHGWSVGGGSPHSPDSAGGNGHGGVNPSALAESIGEFGSPNGHGDLAGNGDGHGGASPARGMPPNLDFAAAMSFAGKVMGDLGGAMTSIMSVLGMRLGLFGALAGGPATSAELAGRTGCAERYVREWLWCLTSAGYLQYNRADQRFTLPVEHAVALTFEGTPFCLAAGYELLTPLASMVDEVAEAFHTGQGIPYERYPMQLYTAMERMSSTWLDTMLVDQWLPGVDGLVARLEGGGKVADIGSGAGRALIRMAQRFGAAQFVGYDLYAPNVERATEAARQAGVADRVHFENVDATTALTAPLDLVTMFDVLHDAPDPEALLRAAHTALTPAQGVLLVLESNSADNAEDNAGPSGSVLYATSTLYCLPTALSEGGPGLGTLGLPPGELSALANRAGFNTVDEVPISSPLNALYVLRP